MWLINYFVSFLLCYQVELVHSEIVVSDERYRESRRRASVSLAPEINKDHPHASHRRNPELKKCTVSFFVDTEEAELTEFKNEFEEFITAELGIFSLIHLELPQALSEEIILEIREKSFVQAVEHSVELRQNNFYWNKKRIGAKDAKDVNMNQKSSFGGDGEGVYIFVIDSGVDDHSDFGARINRDLSAGFGTRSADDSYDCNGHGTSVAGVAAGQSSGIATGATIVSLAVMDCQTHVVESHIIELALERVGFYASSLFPVGIVVNLSNGFTSAGETSVALRNAEQDLQNKGAVIVRAAGNLGKDACDYGQTNLQHSISVGSVNNEESIARHSNHGTCVDIYAPGEDISVPLHSERDNAGEGLGFRTGTSFAAPMVAGAAAVLWAQSPISSASSIQSQLLTKASAGLIKNVPNDVNNKLLHLPAIPLTL
eukprot:Awhi_evm1s5695